MLEISDQEREFELAGIEFRAKMRLRKYRREYTPPQQPVKPGQSLAAHNADHLLKIYGGSDPEAALRILYDRAQVAGVPRDSLERFLHAGYVPQPKQLLFHAAARACDRPTGPVKVGFGGARAGGKALALDTPIPTPDGFSPMRDLAIGDRVFAPDGTVTSITATSEVMLNHDCMLVTFSDGATIVADAEHLWVTMSKTERAAAYRRTEEFRKRRRETRPSRGTGRRPATGLANSRRKHEYLPVPEGSVRTTSEIASSLFYGEETNHAVKVCNPLLLPDADVPIEPYVLGAWLGDGDQDRGYITCFDPEILSELARRGHPTRETKAHGKFIISDLSRPQLRAEELFKNKHIPEVYFRASFEQRLALLQGLMDTDGTAAKDGQCSFTNTSYRLAEGTFRLALTLGIKASMNEGLAKLEGRVIGPKWTVLFYSELQCFRLERKLKRQKRRATPNGVTKLRFITAITPVPSVPVKCITVDHPSHCFLAGERFIPTHNSHTSLAQAVIDDMQREPGLQVLFLRLTLKKARESFEKLRRNVLMGVEHTYKGGVLTLLNGSSCLLGHHGTAKDIGIEYDLLVIEEVTQIPISVQKDLATNVRTSKPNWRPRQYYTTNPGGVAHEDFKKEFYEPWRTHTEKDTRFVPSTHKDNVFINPEYVRTTLDTLSGWKLKAWRDGDWDIAAGQYYTNWSYPHVVNANVTIMPGSQVWCALDYGFTHPTVCYLLSNYDGKIQVIDEHWRQKGLVSQNAEDILNMLKRHELTIDHLTMFVAGPDVFAKRGNDADTTIADEYLQHGIELKPANTDRINGAGEILTLLGSPLNPFNPDGSGGPVDPKIEIHERCRHLTECIPRMQHNPNRPEDVLKVNVDDAGQGGDDPYDTLRYGVTTPLPAIGGGLAMGSAGGWGYRP